ncbi:hypothetical protein D0Z03_003018 [Geotrichum reessii]|nr:hypothetical protein D0Z03_003018 [Galactomyces reessii]
MTSCTNTKRKASFEPTFQEDVLSDIEEEGFSSFKRIKLNEPIYISSDLKDDSVSYNNRNYLNDDEDEEDEDEDMPKFQYESKFKKSVSANNSTTFSDLVLFNKFIDFNCSVHDDDDESYDHISHAAELPQQVQQQIHIIDEKSVDVDIPLITSPDLLLPKVSSSETSPIATLPSTSTSNHRWPLSQQDHSTSFSILTNPKKKQVRPALSKAVTTVVDNLFVSQQEQSLEDYLHYDDDDTTTTTTSTEEDSEEFSESDSIEPLIWTDKKIPLCCYRDRNKISSDLMALSRVKNNKKSAINKRSLKSGKAREMIGGLSEW